MTELATVKAAAVPRQLLSLSLDELRVLLRDAAADYTLKGHATEDAVRIGGILLACRARIYSDRHRGEWLSWLRAEGIAPRTAQRFTLLAATPPNSTKTRRAP